MSSSQRSRTGAGVLAALLFLLPTGSVGSALDSNALEGGAAPPAEPLPEALVSAVAEAVSPRLEELGRTIHTWHYVRRARMGLPETGYLPPDDPRVPPFLRSKVARYWDRSVPVRPHATVSGLWVGIDPVMGRTFGGVGDAWAVIQVDLPAGTVFLDLRRPRGPGGADRVLPPAVVEPLARAGCPVRSAHALFTGLEHAPCREVAWAVIDALTVDALLVEFPALRFNDCSPVRDGAFILLRSELVAAGRLKLMTREASDADAAARDRLRIRELYRRALEAGSERRPPWESLEPWTPDEAFEAWMRERLLGCGHYPEDRIPGAPVLGDGDSGRSR